MLQDRFREKGITPIRFAENIARSRTASRIHHNWMLSPSHRMPMLDPSMTHVGIGVAKEGDELIATQIFANLSP